MSESIVALLPIDITLDDDYTKVYARLTYRLLKLGKFTTAILQDVIQQENIIEWESAHIKYLYNEWEKCMIENSSVLNEPKRYGEMRTTLGASIFVELSRLHIILWYNKLRNEQKQVISEKSIPSRNQQSDYFTLWSLNVTNSEFWTKIPFPEELDWNLPVFKYTQLQIIAAVNMLCEVMNDLGDPSGKYNECTKEFLDFFRVLFTRNALFLCQASCPLDILNDIDMREFIDVEETMCRPNVDYFVWCSIYFGSIMRRIYYWTKLRKNEMDDVPQVYKGEIDNCQEWLIELVDLLGNDGYEDCYIETCTEAYTIPGDLEWFTFKYPTKQPVLGSILFELRPQLRKRFQEDQHLSKETVLQKTKHTYTVFMCRINAIFVLNTIDVHMRNMGIQWKNAVLVEQEGIELSHWKLSRPLCPVILQVFSRYVVYNKLHYTVCDDIYEAIILWFKILRYEYDDMLFGRRLTDVIDKLVLD